MNTTVSSISNTPHRFQFKKKPRRIPRPTVRGAVDLKATAVDRLVSTAVVALALMQSYGKTVWLH
jgi:hypothetical protein